MPAPERIKFSARRADTPKVKLSAGLFLLVLALLFSTGQATSAESCSPAKEYITFMEYLRGRSNWKVPEKVRREIARQVSEHCPGAAARVIRVTSLLAEAGVGSKDAIYTGMRFAPEADEVADRFITLFKKSYLESELDLDIATSHKIAAGLTVDYGGTLPALEKEFKQLIDFCSDGSGLAQSKPRCARFATELLTAAKEQSAGVAVRFKKLFDFMVSKDGPALASGQALELAQEVTGASDKAGDSFIEGYRYAISRKGLSKPQTEAIAFARDLVLNQLKASGLKNSKSEPAPEILKNPKS